MPYLLIQTNVAIEQPSALIEQASQVVSEMLGKAENYVMVALQPNTAMSFAGSAEPTAYLELKSLRLPESQATVFSATLCQFIVQQLDIPANRIYIEFTNGQPSLWGWDGRTF